jgi:HD superfamily phosphohydrolase YqeK
MTRVGNKTAYTDCVDAIQKKLVEKAVAGFGNVEVDTGKEPIFELMSKYGNAVIVHGLRYDMDFEREYQLEKVNKKLWHAMAGECYLRIEMGIADEDILNAVRYHTTGRAGMSLLEKVVYIADYISVERDYDDVDVMRELSMNKGLDEAALYALMFSFKSLSKKEKLIHTDSVEYYNELIIEREG